MRSNSGCIQLRTANVAVLLRLGGIHQHREVLYRAIRNGVDVAPNHHAPIHALLKPAIFAERLRQDLELPTSMSANTRPLEVAAIAA